MGLMYQATCAKAGGKGPRSNRSSCPVGSIYKPQREDKGCKQRMGPEGQVMQEV